MTFVGREGIDYGLAVRQHEGYRRALENCGARVVVLEVNREMADCCFVEDTAIVLDEVAVMMSMGARSRRGEPPGIEAELRKYRPIARVELPATIDGGDVVLVGRTLLVGISGRTSGAGAAALESTVSRYGYRVIPVRVTGCLHLKSACTALPDGRLLINPEWIDTAGLGGFGQVNVPAEEPGAGDVLSIGKTVCLPAVFERTAGMIAGLGFEVKRIELSEFAKAEGGVTCLSLILNG